MKKLKKYFRLAYRIFLFGLQREMEYRLDVLTNILSSLCWVNLTLFTILIINSNTGGIGGWTPNQVLLITGSWMVFQGMAHFFFYHNIRQLILDIYNGKLDYAIIKPVSSQFITSFKRVSINTLVGPIEGIIVLSYAINKLSLSVSVVNLVEFFLLAFAAFVVYYSLWFMSATLTIHYPLLDNISQAVPPIINISKFPLSAFPKALTMVFLTIIPIALMTTFPAEILLNRLPFHFFAYALFVSLMFLWASSFFWHWSLKRYTSVA